MSASYKRITRKLFVILNILAAVAFLLSCLAPHLDPGDWWFISIIGLGFAFLSIILVLFIFFWLVFKPKLILISLVSLLFGWKSFSVFLGFKSSEKFEYTKAEGTLRVVTWNVGRFVEWKRNNNKGSQTRMKMMDLLKEQKADVLCLQEFFHSKDSIYYDNLDFIRKELGFPHYYYAWDNDGYLQWVGQIIFSKFPIIDSGMIRYPRPSIPESLIHADILFNKDTIRFYTTHLQSVRFKKEDFKKIESIKKTEEGMVENSKNIFVKLKRGFVHRAAQARIVKEVISNSPHPYIITGDFNDVPNSYTYFTIKEKDLKDAFLESSFGIGRTYSDIAPTLRIDYILTTPDFSVKQFNRIIKEYSDHYLLVADLTIKK
ncbi:MAG: endonuclease/exonuclease/phosphatase family protein [Flavisolibacter sp.]|jgi:endonuclease/exonuclease/phosphatase family metal-dependent hydrolase|nr:endonuclease/exonuclease/phosphatase family protein [Flavisolibacter sp.]